MKVLPKSRSVASRLEHSVVIKQFSYVIVCCSHNRCSFILQRNLLYIIVLIKNYVEFFRRYFVLHFPNWQACTVPVAPQIFQVADVMVRTVGHARNTSPAGQTAWIWHFSRDVIWRAGYNVHALLHGIVHFFRADQMLPSSAGMMPYGCGVLCCVLLRQIGVMQEKRRK